MGRFSIPDMWINALIRKGDGVMAAIAPTRSPYGKNRVAALPRAGALLLVILVTAAGIAPIFPWDKGTTTIDTVPVTALHEQDSPKDELPLSIFNGFQASEILQTEAQAVDEAGSASAPAATPTP
jgi:hypothetical protein